ncbi:MAG: 2,3,4,5-tetrahydropyridine-2,6-dicarboxylate N-succinyltransferase, partial [Lewinella sp.]|nr:2,3,4,5-tetrahydropyridine-2,6-dicarboxylate N-succinyltransferase [Lewinella sp.]
MITIDNLHKSFGRQPVLSGVTLSFDRPGIYAILGPNGSGKTTLIKSILGMAIPDKGRILFQGKDIRGQWHYRRQIDYLPQIARFPDNLRVSELLAMIEDIREEKPQAMGRLIELFGLQPYLDKRLGNLSGGTRQKVNLVQAFMYDSPVIILDEPTNGLDPNQIRQIRELIRHIGQTRTVLVSTHILHEVEMICNRVIIIDQGKIKAADTPANLTSAMRTAGRIEAEIQGEGEVVSGALERLDHVKKVVATPGDDGWTVHAWVKQAILLYFSLAELTVMEAGPFRYHDKIPPKTDLAGVRVVPPGTARYGSFLEPGVILMPGYVNIGAYVGAGSMVDTWATVGSCAQIGRGVHLAGGVGIGGVLEPPGAQPVIVEDGCFIGSRAIIVEGMLVESEAVIGAGVTLT